MLNKLVNAVVVTTAAAAVAGIGFIAGYAMKRKKDITFLDDQLAKADEALEKAEKWVAEKKAALAEKKAETEETGC